MSAKWSSGPAGDGFDASEDGTGRGTPLVSVAYRTSGNSGVMLQGDRTAALNCGTDQNQQIIAFQERGRPEGRAVEWQEDVAYSLNAPNGGGRRQENCIAFAQNQRDEIRELSVSGACQAEPGMKQQTFIAASGVRRLTPEECEALQGFSRGWTNVPYRGKPAADGPRYRAIGNSMAVPCMAWIGERIKRVEAAQ